jgi:hypothetical protein
LPERGPSNRWQPFVDWRSADDPTPGEPEERGKLMSVRDARIDRHGVTLAWVTPVSEPQNVLARLDWLRRALASCAGVCRPLVVEVERALISVDTGLVCEGGPEPARLRFTEATLSGHVWMPEPTRLSPAVLGRVLDAENLHKSVAAHLLLGGRQTRADWQCVEVLASAARVAMDCEALRLEEWPGSMVVSAPRDGMRWVAGPVNVEGLRRYPPIRMRLESIGGIVYLEVTAFWSPWISEGTAEAGYFRSLIDTVAKAGFIRTM